MPSRTLVLLTVLFWAFGGTFAETSADEDKEKAAVKQEVNVEAPLIHEKEEHTWEEIKTSETKESQKEDEVIEEQEDPDKETSKKVPDQPFDTEAMKAQILAKFQQEPPHLTEHEEKGVHLPPNLICDACKASAYQLHKAFQKSHEGRKKDYRLTEALVLDTVEEVCEVRTFEIYGISRHIGENRLKGPGVNDGPGLASMGGRNPWRIAQLCKGLIDSGDEIREHRFYKVWIEGNQELGPLQTEMCDNKEVSDLQMCHDEEGQRIKRMEARSNKKRKKQTKTKKTKKKKKTSKTAQKPPGKCKLRSDDKKASHPPAAAAPAKAGENNGSRDEL